MEEISTSPAPSRATATAAYGLVIALLFCLLPIARWLVHGDSIFQMLAREAVWWCIGLAIVVWLTAIERLPLTSIGFRRPTWKSAAFGLLAAISVAVVMALQFAVLIPLLHASSSAAMAQRNAILSTPYWYRVLLVLRAAVVEELLCRAYIIEKVRQLFGSNTLAVVVSIAAFTFAHLRGSGAVQLIAVAVSGAIFALLYVWRRDLLSNMFGHFLTDALGFLTQ